jgi:hypothetical protein
MVSPIEETGLADGRWPLSRLLGTRREARSILSFSAGAKEPPGD